MPEGINGEHGVILERIKNLDEKLMTYHDTVEDKLKSQQTDVEDKLAVRYAEIDSRLKEQMDFFKTYCAENRQDHISILGFISPIPALKDKIALHDTLIVGLVLAVMGVAFKVIFL